MAYFALHPVDAEDVQSVWDWFGGFVALGICASAGALTYKRYVLAFAVFLGFTVFSMLLLKLLTAVVGPSVGDAVPILIMFGALTGAVAFSVVSLRPGILITGALAGVMGLMLTAVVCWAAWEIWPRRITELEPAVFATLIAFGPIMGLSLGVPFVIVAQKAARDQKRRGTT